MSKPFNVKQYQDRPVIKFKKCYKVFQKEAFNSQGNPVALKLHQSFITEDKNCNSCLGCNLSETIRLLSNYLSNYKQLKDNQNDLVLFLQIQSMIVERIETIFDILNISEDYRDKHFKVFKQIRVWINFFKYTKQYINGHSTTLSVSKSDYNRDLNNYSLIIDETQVFKFFHKEIKIEKIIPFLCSEFDEVGEINRKVLIKMPDIVNVTYSLCESLKRFVDLLVNDKSYIELMRADLIIEEEIKGAQME
jgi:hypothetical protein